MSRESYERARARREPGQAANRGRTANRELIDARGSIDSRAFNEHNELVGYAIDKQDTHDPLIETPGAGNRWRSHSSGEGRRPRRRDSELDRLSDTISGRNQYSRKPASPEFPLAVKVLAALIVVLLIVLAVILFM